MTFLQLQLVLLAYVLLGYIVARMGKVSEESYNQMIDWILNFILPCNIVYSFITQELNHEVIVQSSEVLIANLVLQVCLLLFARVLFLPKRFDDTHLLLQYGLINSSATFVGLPLLSGIYGPLGTLLASMAVIPMRITMWSVGVRYFDRGADGKRSSGRIKKVLLHPCMIAVYIGFAAMCLQIEWPMFVTKTLSGIGDCTAFFAMFLIGVSMATLNFRDILNWEITYYTFVRLILLPVLMLIVMRALNMPETVTGVTVLIAGMPTGSTTGIMAAKYKQNIRCASAMILSSISLSLFTLPVLYYLVVFFCR